MAVRTRKHVSVAFEDITGTPISCTLGPGPGDFKFSGMEQGNVEAVAIQNRGAFLELVEGDTKQHSLSISVFHNQDLTAAASPVAAMLKTNDFASGLTADPGGVVWTGNIRVTVTRAAVTDVWLCTNCRLSFDYSEGKEGNMISISGTCFGGITLT